MGPEEVTFEEYTQDPQRARSKAGFVKIRGACAQAKKDGYNYVWVDTNCIAKSNRVELDEAINSMFRWYKEAGVCYAYLADVPDSAVAVDKRGQLTVSSSFDKSRWFTRGWTLQELLAPKNVVFYSQNWRPLGTKNTLQHPICQITGVPAEYLIGNKPLRAASVAQRMSWMSKRVTHRLEDMAYSVLGIFDIHIPFIYGEGAHAFLRLQEAILHATHDHTIFCWEWNHAVDRSWANVLAPCPEAFSKSAVYSPKLWSKDDKLTSYKISNGGLWIEVPIVQTADPSVVLAVLEVQVHGQESNEFRVGLPLRTGRLHQRLPFPFQPVPIDNTVLGVTNMIKINASDTAQDHRFTTRVVSNQEDLTNRLHADLSRAARSRVGFFLAFQLDDCEVELVTTQPGFDLLKSVSMVAFTEGTTGGSSSFMATTVKIKHRTFGETFILLAVRRHGSGYLYYTQALPPNQRHTKKSIEDALAKLRDQSARERGDKSYQSGREVCATLGGSFYFSGNGGPIVKTVQVWDRNATGSIIPVRRVMTGFLGSLKRTLLNS